MRFGKKRIVCKLKKRIDISYKDKHTYTYICICRPLCLKKDVIIIFNTARIRRKKRERKETKKVDRLNYLIVKYTQKTGENFARVMSGKALSVTQHPVFSLHLHTSVYTLLVSPLNHVIDLFFLVPLQPLCPLLLQNVQQQH